MLRPGAADTKRGRLSCPTACIAQETAGQARPARRDRVQRRRLRHRAAKRPSNQGHRCWVFPRRSAAQVLLGSKATQSAGTILPRFLHSFLRFPRRGRAQWRGRPWNDIMGPLQKKHRGKRPIVRQPWNTSARRRARPRSFVTTTGGFA